LGLARVAVARGHYTRALELYRALLDETPTPEVATAIGDILARGGDTHGASQMYARAATLTRE
jgi:predicted negative regulator of RcsB-dependent stress response